MKSCLLRHASKGIFLGIGLVIGIPAGYMLSGESTRQTSVANPDMIKLSLPKDFFANLPEADSEDARLLDVDTYTFATRHDDPLVLPRMGVPPHSDGTSGVPGTGAN